MKKVLMTIAGALLISVTATYAQTDTTQRRRNDQPPGQVTPSTQQQQGQQSMYRTQDRITVPADQVPSSLRQTLQGSQYKGWETAPLYQDRATQEYYFELPDANGTTRRLHRFDRNGKAIEGTGTGTDDRSGSGSGSGAGTDGGSQEKP